MIGNWNSETNFLSNWTNLFLKWRLSRFGNTPFNLLPFCLFVYVYVCLCIYVSERVCVCVCVCVLCVCVCCVFMWGVSVSMCFVRLCVFVSLCGVCRYVYVCTCMWADLWKYSVLQPLTVVSVQKNFKNTIYLDIWYTLFLLYILNNFVKVIWRFLTCFMIRWRKITSCFYHIFSYWML